MPSRYRDFGTPADACQEPVVFTINDETFHCLPDLPGGAFEDLMVGVRLNEFGQRVYEADSLTRFIRAALREQRPAPVEDVPDGTEVEVVTPDEARRRGHVISDELATAEKVALVPADDVARWNALVRDKRRVVPLKTIGEVAMWLGEEMLNRPSV